MDQKMLIVLLWVVCAIIVVAAIVLYNGKKKTKPGTAPSSGTASTPGRITGTGVRKIEGTVSTSAAVRSTATKTEVRNPGASAAAKKPEPEKEAPVDTRSADEHYAAARGLWICKYCESLNPYPEGMAPKKKEPELPERKTLLRGQLANKNIAPVSVSRPRGSRMCCVACGKLHQ